MKAQAIASLALALALLAPVALAQTPDEPRFVNRMLWDISTPAITPGHDGVFSLSVRNPDQFNLTGTMEDVSLHVAIYRYLTLTESEAVVNISHPPVIEESGSQELDVDCGDIAPGGSFPVAFTIDTDRDTPHGSYFSQSTYLVSFVLSFTYDGVNYTMASRGCFSDAQWEALKEGDTGAGEINQDYLEQLGYDGIIPDSAFSVRIPIPTWPFYILVGLTALTGFMAFFFHVLDNPGRYPKLEKRFFVLAGRLSVRRRLMRRKLGRKGRSPPGE